MFMKTSPLLSRCFNVARPTFSRHVFPYQSMRSFASINWEDYKPENSVLKLYNTLVEKGQIKEDPN